MKRVLIFGTGISAEKVILNINNQNSKIIGYLDNNKKKHGQMFHGKTIYAPKKCNELDYDYIIIASVKYEPIMEELKLLNVDANKIIPYFMFSHANYDEYREVLHIEGILYDELNCRIEDIHKYIANMEYEVVDKIKKKLIQIPKIKSIDDTIDEIIEKKLSVSRYGDGEFDIIHGRKINFQDASIMLADKLKEALTVPVDNHVVALADIYGDLSQLETKYANFFREFLIEFREEHYMYLDMNRQYYNAFITRIYSEMRDKSHSGIWFEKMKKIWEKRDVIIVEGDKTRFGIGNNLLMGASSVQRILAPNENAFSKYEDVLNACEKYGKEVLFLVALGPTATAMVYDLAKLGYQAIDIGHLDIEYEWYLRGVTKHKVVIKGKYTNEVPGGNVVEDVYDEQYEKQIVARFA